METDNIISIKKIKTKEDTENKQEEYDFSQILEKNKKNKERESKARDQANKAVKRSYRLDKNDR